MAFAIIDSDVNVPTSGINERIYRRISNFKIKYPILTVKFSKHYAKFQAWSIFVEASKAKANI